MLRTSGELSELSWFNDQSTEEKNASRSQEMESDTQQQHIASHHSSTHIPLSLVDLYDTTRYYPALPSHSSAASLRAASHPL